MMQQPAHGHRLFGHEAYYCPLLNEVEETGIELPFSRRPFFWLE